MKHYLMAVIVLWTSSYINAGIAPVQEPVDLRVIAKIRDEGLNRSQALETFSHFTEVIGPRLTATPAYKNAAEWARDKLKEWGLENPRLEAWEFGRGWTLEKFTVYFNIDPGAGPIYGFYLENNEAVKPIFDAWLEPFRDLGARRNIIQGIGNTDHLSFTRAGMSGFNPVQEYANYDVRTHHTNMDTYERVRDADLRQAAVVMASFAYHASARQEKIPLAKSKSE